MSLVGSFNWIMKARLQTRFQQNKAIYQNLAKNSSLEIPPPISTLFSSVCRVLRFRSFSASTATSFKEQTRANLDFGFRGARAWHPAKGIFSVN